MDPRHRAALWALAGALLGALAPAAASTPGERPAADYLELESVLDGRCQILSEGGKLRVLRNTHPEKTITYRLIRVFAGGHRQGLSAGRAPAGGEPVALGCSRVDGRAQDWVVERARFEEDRAP